MRILYFHPLFQTQDHPLRMFEQPSFEVVGVCTMAEAIQSLPQQPVDLMIVHREGPQGQGDPGMTFLDQVRADAKFGTTPIILTTEVWTDEQCAFHQDTPSGANAYLWVEPGHQANPEALKSLIEGVLEVRLTVPKPAGLPDLSRGSPEPPESGVVLEDATQIQAAPDVSSSLQFEAPVEIEAEVLIQGTPVLQEPQEIAPEEEVPPPPVEPPAVVIESPEPEAIPHELPLPAFPSSKAKAETLIPGASGQTPDVETLKKYLLLREQDVETLAAQVEVLKEHVADIEGKLTLERARNAELNHMFEEAERKTQSQMETMDIALTSARQEADDLRFQLKTKADKGKLLELKVREAADEVEKLRERVRLDVRKIRTREKELENRLEVLRKDSEILIEAREKKIVELKQKIDVLEFNMDLLQDRYAKEQRMTAEMRDRLARASQAMKLAGGLLGEDAKASESGSHDPESTAKKAG